MLEKGEVKLLISALITVGFEVMGLHGTKFFANGMGQIADRGLFTNLQMPLILTLLVWWSRDERTALKR